MLGLLRPSGVFASPTGRATGDSQSKDGLWQDAQLVFSARLRRGSTNSIVPSSASTQLSGVLSGNGIASGRARRLDTGGVARRGHAELETREHEDQRDRPGVVAPRKTRCQSSRIATTVQPRPAASSKPRASRPTGLSRS